MSTRRRTYGGEITMGGRYMIIADNNVCYGVYDLKTDTEYQISDQLEIGSVELHSGLVSNGNETYGVMYNPGTDTLFLGSHLNNGGFRSYMGHASVDSLVGMYLSDISVSDSIFNSAANESFYTNSGHLIYESDQFLSPEISEYQSAVLFKNGVFSPLYASEYDIVTGNQYITYLTLDVSYNSSVGKVEYSYSNASICSTDSSGVITDLIYTSDYDPYVLFAYDNYIYYLGENGYYKINVETKESSLLYMNHSSTPSRYQGIIL